MSSAPRDVLRVLFVEDSPTDAKLTLHELRSAWPQIEHERVETVEAMQAALTRARWDLIICDWSMPTFSAALALKVVEELALDLPFVIVSGTIGEETAVAAIRAGAHDYVLKDKLWRLVPVVERELREAEERAARRRAEVALRESEVRFARLFESGIIGILISDFAGAVSVANDGFLSMVGYTRADLAAGRVHWAQLMPATQYARGIAALSELGATGVAPPWETECVAQDGSLVPVLIGAATLPGDQCILSVVDLRERRQAQQLHAQLSDEANREQAARRRAEDALRTSEEQLRHAQKMEAVGRLAGGVAHDFNNLLSVVLSYCTLIMDDVPPDSPIRGDLHQIARAGQRATELTRQLLAFSRQTVIEPRIIDLNHVLAETDKMVRRLVGEDVEVCVVQGAGLGKIKADPGHVEQVLMNLVVNARDAMPSGGTLTIETAMAELDERYASEHMGVTAGTHVRLSVRDTGVGMDKATQERIFEPFFTTKALGKGTGLGLSTVFGIVHQSGGTVWVTSAPGDGATFDVYFPCTDEAEGTIVAAVRTGILRGSETVLLVEDEEQVRVVVHGILSRNGYSVIEALDAGDAVRLAQLHGERVDLLLTDCVMPQMSGQDLATRLTRAHPKLRVLYMSGYTERALGEHVGQAAGSVLLQKPITPDLLLRKVREVLDRAP